MSDEEFLDPYVYPGTTVLRNLLNETDAAALDQAEYDLTFLRREELARHPLTGPFALPRLQETHRRLVQDVYRWAVEIRTVEIRKGSSQFHLAELLVTGADATFDWLEESGLHEPDTDDDAFVTLASDVLEKLNYLQRSRVASGANTCTSPTGAENTCARAGCLCSR